MRYRDVTPNPSNRFRLPEGYPVLAEVNLDPVNWFEFERHFANTEVTKIIGRDTPRDGRMVVHVACASASVRDRLEDGWD